MRRITAILLALAMFFSVTAVSVFAEEDVVASVTAKMDYDDNVINITYTSNLKYDAYITFYMTYASNVTSFTDFDNIIRIDQVICKAGQSVDAEIKSGADLDGAYDIFAVPSGTKGQDGKAKATLTIVAEDERDGILLSINQKTDTDIATEIYSKLAEALEFEETSCPAWKNVYLYDMKTQDYSGEYKSFSDIDKAWSMADAIYALRNANTIDSLAEAIADNANEIGLDTENDDYVEFNEVFCKRFMEEIKKNNVMSKKETVEVFETVSAITAINERDVKKKAEVFASDSEYLKILGIDKDLQKKIEKAGTANIARLMEDFTADDTKTIVDKIEELADEINNAPDSTGDSSSSGGVRRPSAGGGGGGVTVPTSSKEVNEDDYVKPGEVKLMFSDVTNEYWAKAPIEALATDGIINGYEDGTFRGDNLVNREEFVKMIVSAFDLKADGENAFSDVNSDFWAAGVISTAVSCGIIKGVSDTEFGVGQPITRQDMAVIIDRVLAYCGKSLETGQISFIDAESISDYATESVNKLTTAGLINGFEDGTFKGLQELTRAEAAKVIDGARASVK